MHANRIGKIRNDIRYLKTDRLVCLDDAVRIPVNRIN
jgi:hypothetical protein